MLRVIFFIEPCDIRAFALSDRNIHKLAQEKLQQHGELSQKYHKLTISLNKCSGSKHPISFLREVWREPHIGHHITHLTILDVWPIDWSNAEDHLRARANERQVEETIKTMRDNEMVKQLIQRVAYFRKRPGEADILETEILGYPEEGPPWTDHPLNEAALLLLLMLCPEIQVLDLEIFHVAHDHNSGYADSAMIHPWLISATDRSGLLQKLHTILCPESMQVSLNAFASCSFLPSLRNVKAAEIDPTSLLYSLE